MSRITNIGAFGAPASKAKRKGTVFTETRTFASRPRVTLQSIAIFNSALNLSAASVFAEAGVKELFDTLAIAINADAAQVLDILITENVTLALQNGYGLANICDFLGSLTLSGKINFNALVENIIDVGLNFESSTDVTQGLGSIIFEGVNLSALPALQQSALALFENLILLQTVTQVSVSNIADLYNSVTFSGLLNISNTADVILNLATTLEADIDFANIVSKISDTDVSFNASSGLTYTGLVDFVSALSVGCSADIQFIANVFYDSMINLNVAPELARFFGQQYEHSLAIAISALINQRLSVLLAGIKVDLTATLSTLTNLQILEFAKYLIYDTVGALTVVSVSDAAA